jgi:Holliday junction resolvase RusA-like endonuclease
MKNISFFVPGDPKAQPRSRSFVLRGRGGAPIMKNGQPIIRVHDPGTAENWKSCIAEKAKEFIPFKLPLFPAQNEDGTFNAVYVALTFIFERPKAHFRSNGKDLKDWAPAWNSSRMDCDNLAKAVLDCLTVLGFWKDDGIVCRLDVSKSYCGIGQASGCWIAIEPLDSKLNRTYQSALQVALKI